MAWARACSSMGMAATNPGPRASRAVMGAAVTVCSSGFPERTPARSFLTKVSGAKPACPTNATSRGNFRSSSTPPSAGMKASRK